MDKHKAIFKGKKCRKLYYFDERISKLEQLGEMEYSNHKLEQAYSYHKRSK